MFQDTKDLPVIVLDNSSIHKSLEIKEFIQNSGVIIFDYYSLQLLTQSYRASHWINKLKDEATTKSWKLRIKHSITNRPLCIRMIKKVVDEIAESRLEDYIKASIKETLQRIRIFVG